MLTEKAKTIAANLLVIALMMLLMIWGNTWWRQRTQFTKGEKALAERNYIAALAGYEAAIHMYTPASSLVEKSAERLWEIGAMHEQAGDPQKALVAYRALRSSFYSTHGLIRPGEDWIARCDARIAEILKRQGY
ncbi:MAG: hypothetical protein HYS23_14200 [Geobacter sp.]|nr:hypothetical protein [Geobacter sp.]